MQIQGDYAQKSHCTQLVYAKKGEINFLYLDELTHLFPVERERSLFLYFKKMVVINGQVIPHIYITFKNTSSSHCFKLKSKKY